MKKILLLGVVALVLCSSAFAQTAQDVKLRTNGQMSAHFDSSYHAFLGVLQRTQVPYHQAKIYNKSELIRFYERTKMMDHMINDVRYPVDAIVLTEFDTYETLKFDTSCDKNIIAEMLQMTQHLNGFKQNNPFIIEGKKFVDNQFAKANGQKTKDSPLSVFLQSCAPEEIYWIRNCISPKLKPVLDEENCKGCEEIMDGKIAIFLQLAHPDLHQQVATE